MSFRKANNITGWIVCLIACVVYVMTMEPTGSFWDCGEFVSSCFKLQIPHPPGAPLFVLLGRLFIVVFGDDPLTAAKGVNFMSAIASGFTILFLFWTITHFARKIVQPNEDQMTRQQMISILSAGVVGALAYTFSDSFWYSAVEGEVYALSSFFTAIVFWGILKWEQEVDYDRKHGINVSRADRWIVLLFYLMGLSIGVHLLNLLTIPAIVMVYYFKRYKVTPIGAIVAFLIGCAITGVVQTVVIKWSIQTAGWFDRLFVNSFGLPFFSGFIFFFILVAALMAFGLRFALKRGYYFLKLGLWCVAFMILGYSTYFTTLIRSNADPGIDMYNVDNPVNLSGYLGREQYGDWPIVFGPDFMGRDENGNIAVTRPAYKETGNLYIKGKDKYEAVGKVQKQDWSGTPGAHLFPRMFDSNNDRGQHQCYREFSGLAEGEIPTMADNIKYFASYQFRWMYWRYFMWNFAGKQNDLQGFGNIRDGNWISGIGFIDKMLHGSTTDELPATAGKDNKANNKLFLLPFILGVLGFIYQLMVNRRDWIITGLLFFFTGFAIVIYLNQAGYQPRERDYAYVGSFYAFAIWIGLGVLQVREWLNKIMSVSLSNYVAFGLCLLAVPILMASQEWDDHDRSKKLLARDLGKDYLESCAQNAILISFGDNDTYPLWYALETENIRPDLRVMNYSLLGTDWYVNQLRYKVNNSAPADVIFTPEQLQGNKRDAVPVYPLPGFDQNRYYDAYEVLKNVTGSDDPRYMVSTQDGSQMLNVMPTRKLSIPVDVNKVRQNGTVQAGDNVVSTLLLDIKKNYLFKNDLAVLALIAANKWERPIYFTSTQELDELGLLPYVRMEGLSYRLVPVAQSEVNNDATFDNIMKKFAYGNAALKGVYFDEENRRHINSIRATHAASAMSLVNAGKLDSARKVLRKYDTEVSSENVPYGMTSNRQNQHNVISLRFLYAAYRAGDTELAKKVSTSLKSDLQEQMRYYRLLGDQITDEQIATDAMNMMEGKPNNISDKQLPFIQDIASTYQMLRNVSELETQYGPQKPANPEGSRPIQNPGVPDTQRRP
ncbi:MAG TPA: DUF2723 domain-containing protein [Chitinophagaceae bacterium]|nr:DUF2723 domain-containing protein [Chitinophagaceae bacterium]